ncbi:MAG: GNAT family N-acetyltransferase [Bacteroidota bacterium]
MTELISIRPISEAEVHPLTQLARDTFYRSFIYANTEERMKAYLDTQMSEKVMAGELADEKNIFFVLMVRGSWAGYAKLRQGQVPDCVLGRHPIELERFYIHQDYHANGLGSLLMQHCIQWAVAEGKQTLWLGVWEENEGAIHFYRKKGFLKKGDKPFMMHDDLQKDWIMEKAL